MPAIAAAGVLGVVVIAGLSGGGSDATDDTTVSSVSIGSSTVDTVGTTVPVVTATDPSQTKTVFAQSVTFGAVSDDVKQLQQRLTDLGFAPGPADGIFGSSTQQAVWAYKKLVLGVSAEELRDSNNASQVTPEMWTAMQDTITIPAQRPQGAGRTHLEVYLPLQVAVFFTDNRPVLITHISSGELDENGEPELFCETVTLDTDEKGNALPEPIEKAICAYAKTPGGVFKFERHYDGKRMGPLGGMTNPWYFNYGIAIHGAENVPLSPASHGCVRVNQMVGEIFPTLVEHGDRVYVWGHDGKQPEQYSRNESLPSFNFPDPDATTTTTSTTTTTTIAPVTTTTRPPTTTPPTTSTTTTTTSTTTTTAP